MAAASSISSGIRWNSALQELKYPTAAALSTVVVALLAVWLLAALILTTRKRVGDLSTMFQALKR